MRFVLNLFVLLFAFILLFSCSDIEQKKDKNESVVYECNVEEIDTKENKFNEVSAKNIFFRVDISM